MAFGKPTEIKRIKNAVLEDKLWRTYVLSEEAASQTWKSKWDWILDEYTDLQGKLQELSKASVFLSDVKGAVKEEDPRDIRPIPQTTNHQYGWLPNKPEFNLEKYGPDVSVPAHTLPDIYRILHD